jgi:hypothetical protein
MLGPAFFFLGAILMATEEWVDVGMKVDNDAVRIACAPYTTCQMLWVESQTPGVSGHPF